MPANHTHMTGAVFESAAGQDQGQVESRAGRPMRRLPPLRSMHGPKLSPVRPSPPCSCDSKATRPSSERWRLAPRQPNAAILERIILTTRQPNRRGAPAGARGAGNQDAAGVSAGNLKSVSIWPAEFLKPTSQAGAHNVTESTDIVSPVEITQHPRVSTIFPHRAAASAASIRPTMAKGPKMRRPALPVP
jgi:hypothetical protein